MSNKKGEPVGPVFHWDGESDIDPQSALKALSDIELELPKTNAIGWHLVTVRTFLERAAAKDEAENEDARDVMVAIDDLIVEREKNIVGSNRIFVARTHLHAALLRLVRR